MAPRTSLSVTSLASLDQSSSCRLGFVGCGTIAVAIATGLATQNAVTVEHVAVSRRSAAKSAALQAQFPYLVSVHDDNQAVVDASDVIFLTVLPTQVAQVLGQIKLDPTRHVLISLVSTASLADLQEAASDLPSSSIFRMICLPSVAVHSGVCLMTPPAAKDSLLHNLLDTLGGVVPAQTEDNFRALMVPSGLMGSFYALLRQNRDYVMQHGGLDGAQATVMVGKWYESMVRDVLERVEDNENEDKSRALDDLIAEQTPGGLNEQGIVNLTKLGVWEAYGKVQSALHDRIAGKSDGSLSS